MKLDMSKQKYKLYIDLVPQTCWGKSLYRKMKPSQWTKLRKQVIADAGGACVNCGSDNRLTCHELWEYDITKKVQRLVGFKAICSDCNLVTHFGLAQTLAEQGKIDINKYIEHFCDVNQVDLKAFKNHKTQAFDIWRKRSKVQWKTDLGEWSHLIPDAPL